MMGDLITSQQLMQRNLMANCNVMHELEDAQQVLRSNLDQLSRQIAQLANPISNTREGGGGIPAQEQLPKEETPSRTIGGAHCPSQVTVQLEDTEDSDEETNDYMVISPGEPAPIPATPKADLSWEEKKDDIPCMEASKLPKSSEECTAEESKGDEETVGGENVFPTIQNPLPSKCTDLKILEAELLQDECPTPSIEEKDELEALTKGELFGTQGLGDEEIDATIMDWCMKREHTSSTESGNLRNPYELTIQRELPTLEAEQELPSSTTPPPDSTIQLPPNIKHAYWKKNGALPVIKRSQGEELRRVLRRHKITLGWALTEVRGIHLALSMRYTNLEEVLEGTRRWPLGRSDLTTQSGLGEQRTSRQSPRLKIRE